MSKADNTGDVRAHGRGSRRVLRDVRDSRFWPPVSGRDVEAQGQQPIRPLGNLRSLRGLSPPAGSNRLFWLAGSPEKTVGTLMFSPRNLKSKNG